MNQKKTIFHKLSWLVLCMAVLAVLLSSLPVMAQVKAEEVKIDLGMRIIGDYYNEVKAGQDNRFYLELRNYGTRPLTNIRLISDKAEDWVVEFTPANLAYLGTGEAQTVDINIRPPDKINRGEYRFTVIAEATETRRAESFWVRVDSQSYWLWIAAIVGAVVVAGFIIIFIRFGRK
ncbi:MAG: NEW3 domain-containing protein [Dehalococcoidales bacterium]|nr:NEW3 domain-containing protein [Dehalococcoidales bacterium]